MEQLCITLQGQPYINDQYYKISLAIQYVLNIHSYSFIQAKYEDVPLFHYMRLLNIRCNQFDKKLTGIQIGVHAIHLVYILQTLFSSYIPNDFRSCQDHRNASCFIFSYLLMTIIVCWVIRNTIIPP